MPTTTSYPGCTVCCGGSTDTDCCPDPILETLNVTTVGILGCDPCADDTFTIAWDGSIWTGSKALSCGFTLTVSMRCFETMPATFQWQFRLQASGGTCSASADSGWVAVSDSDCSPFEQHYVWNTFDANCCSGGSSIDVTVTE